MLNDSSPNETDRPDTPSSSEEASAVGDIDGRQANEPPTSNAERMFALYRGNEKNRGVTRLLPPNGDGAKVEGKSYMEDGPLTVGIWQKHLDGKVGCGAIPIFETNKVVFAAIDIDDYTITPEKMVACIAEEGLPLVPIRSKSGGWHLTLFLKEPVRATLVRITLNGLAYRLLGASGTEVFPKQNELWGDNKGSFINAPYFGETRKAYGPDAQSVDIDTFFEMVEAARIDEETLLALTNPTKDGAEVPKAKLKPPPYEYPIEVVGAGARDNELFAHIRWLRNTGYEDDELQELAEWFNDHMLEPPLEPKVVADKVRRRCDKEVGWGAKRARIIPAVRECDATLSAILEPDVYREIIALKPKQIARYVRGPLQERLGDDFPAALFREKIRSARSEYAVIRGDTCRRESVWTKARGEEERTTVLCNSELAIRQVIIADDGVTREEAAFWIEGTNHDGVALPLAEVKQASLNALGNVPAWGNHMIVRPRQGEQLRCAVQTMSEERGDVQQIVEYQHTGWRAIDGKLGYLTASGHLTADGLNTDVRVRLGGSDVYNLLSLPAEGIVDRRVLDAFLGMAPPHITVPLLGAVGRSLLGDTPSFGLFLAGETGTHKTGLAACAQSFFCAAGVTSPDAQLFANFKDTANAMEKKAFDFKDALLVFDDYAPAAQGVDAHSEA